MAITDSCAAGREMPRTKNQSKNILSYGLRVRVYSKTIITHSAKSYLIPPSSYVKTPQPSVTIITY